MENVFIRQYRESGYFVWFDPKNGFSLRTSLTGTEPFWNKRGPELLDISITNYCERGCDFCYRVSNRNGTFMPLSQYKDIIVQAETVGVMQVALGGGNPNQHPKFIDILRITREHHIIPTYTTNGQGMSNEIYAASKEYCGAIAVSWYEPFVDAWKVVEECCAKGIKINIHVLLHKGSIQAATQLLRNESDLLRKVNAIVFLNYKPIHGTQDLRLSDNEDLSTFLSAVYMHSGCKLGFDSCMISYLMKLEENLKLETIEFCEAGRFSAFISEKGILFPCSFMNDTDCTGIDLRKTTLEQGWRFGDEFQRIRQQLTVPGMQLFPIEKCKQCTQYPICHGGCPIFPINRCREEQSHE